MSENRASKHSHSKPRDRIWELKIRFTLFIPCCYFWILYTRKKIPCNPCIEARNYTSPQKYRPAQDQCQNASVGNQWWDDHHLHKFGKTLKDTQHPTTQQQTYRSPINIYTKKGSSKLCSLMNTLTSFKLIKFWQRGLVQKSNMNSVVRLWQQC